MNKRATAKLLLVAIFIAISVLCGVVSYHTMQLIQGDPYEQRAQGAAGICPISRYETTEEASWIVYECQNQEQRDAAADVVRERFHLQALSIAALFAGFSACITADSLLRASPRSRRTLYVPIP